MKAAYSSNYIARLPRTVTRLLCLACLLIAVILCRANSSAATPGGTSASKGNASTSGGMGMPTSGYVTTLFGEPISYENSGYYYDQNNTLQYANFVFHHGIDVSGGCTAGVDPVYAATAGTVALAQYLTDGYGTQVVIDNGYNTGGNGQYTYTFYSHMGSRTSGAEFINVSPGQYVQAGQLIGYQGNDGSVYGSCGPDPGTHLDWEIRVSTTALSYSTTMRYNSTAASPNFYTLQQVSYTDSSPSSYVTAGNFSTLPPTQVPQATATPRPTSTPRPTNTPVPPTPQPGPCGMNFSDLDPSHWAYSYIADLFCRHVISGFPDGTFRPWDSTTRGQFTKMLVLSMGWNLYNPSAPSFNDVAPGSPYYTYIETAHLRDVISGYEDGTFRPNAEVTRGQTSKMVVLGKGWQPDNSGTGAFWDVVPGDWAYGYIQTAYTRGIIDGYNDGTFRPGFSITRSQLSKMLSLSISATGAQVRPPQRSQP